MLIFVHLPKTAGTSVVKFLREHHGENEKFESFSPLTVSAARRMGGAIRGRYRNRMEYLGRDAKPLPTLVYGHFMPYRYKSFLGRNDVTFVTWLRDPIERVASHYHYWKRNYFPKTALPFQRRVVEENWSEEAFYFCEEMRNAYTKFLWGFPLESFDFVGITEHFDEEFPDFAEVCIGRRVESEAPVENANPERKGRYVEDGELRRRLEHHHARDYALWRKAHAMREERLRAASSRAA